MIVDRDCTDLVAVVANRIVDDDRRLVVVPEALPASVDVFRYVDRDVGASEAIVEFAMKRVRCVVLGLNCQKFTESLIRASVDGVVWYLQCPAQGKSRPRFLSYSPLL